MIIVTLIVSGLIFGSFVNAFVWRLHKGKDWVRGRSECTHCHHRLAAKDLVPVLSWLALRGKCRYCGRKIEDGPLVELAVPLLFVLSYFFWPEPLQMASMFEFCLWIIFLVGFVALAVYDLRWFLLPNRIVYPLLILAAVQTIVVATFYNGGWPKILSALASVLIIGGTFYILFHVSKATWIGGGDVKLGAVLGFLVGGPFDALLLIFIASFLGSLAAVPLLITGKVKRNAHIPFGPFLILSLIIVRLFGSNIINWYKTLL